MSPLKQINFAIYDDSKVSLTGIIDNKEFGEMLKKAYMNIVMHKINEHAKNND